VSAGFILLLALGAAFCVGSGVRLLVARRRSDRGSEALKHVGDGAWLCLRRPYGDFQTRNRRCRVSVDGRDVAAISEAGELLLSVDPGPHRVRARLDLLRSNEVEVDVNPNQTVTLTVADAFARGRVRLPFPGMGFLKLVADESEAGT
jgi:hypothetical protein